MVFSVGAGTSPVTVTWWHEPDRDNDEQGTYGIVWAALDGDSAGGSARSARSGRVCRTGRLSVSQRTADPANPYDAAVTADLHRELAVRLGMLVRVEPVTRHLPALDVHQRLAVRGCRVQTVNLPPHHQHVLGGLIVDTNSRTATVAVDRDLDPSERDLVLLWAEKHLPDLADPGLSTTMDSRADTGSSWRRRTTDTYERLARQDSIHLYL